MRLISVTGLACLRFQEGFLALDLLILPSPMSLDVRTNHNHTTPMHHRRNKMQSLRNVCENLVSTPLLRHVLIFRSRVSEREQAEEEAKIRNAEREAHSSQMRLASHQDRAFNLGKEGRGREMRDIIEQHDLDVTKPRNLKPSKKQIKQADQSCFIETMLHVAAASCDVSLVNWLIQRGADTAALDPSRHTPFHVSILKGNIPVVECFLTLYRDTKSTDPRYLSVREGCHPSKASKDVQSDTPLQMAIKCGKLELMELLLKDATVHDVEKCWAQFQPDDTSGREIKELLLTKVSVYTLSKRVHFT